MSKIVKSIICCTVFLFCFGSVASAAFKSIDLAANNTAFSFSKVAQLQNKRIAVISFRNVAQNNTDSFAPIFEDELAVSLIMKFAKNIIARNQTERILDELKTSREDIFDEKNRKQFGKLASADVIVTGTYRLDKKEIVVNVTAIDVETGIALASHRVNIKRNAVSETVRDKDEFFAGNDIDIKKFGMRFWEMIKPVKIQEKLGFGFGWTSVADYGINDFEQPTDSFDMNLIFRWVYLSYRYGGDLFNEEGNKMDVWLMALHIPTMDREIIGQKFQLFGIVGYQWENVIRKIIDKNQLEASGMDYKRINTIDKSIKGILGGAKIRWILSKGEYSGYSVTWGLDLSYERVWLSQRVEGVSFMAENIFKLHTVILWGW